MSRTLTDAFAGIGIKPSGEIVSWRGEYAAVWDGWVYPFRTEASATDFLRMVKSGQLNLQDKWERYPVSVLGRGPR